MRTLLVLMLCPATVALAQMRAWPMQPDTSRWAIMLHVGTYDGGPENDVDKALTGAGYTLQQHTHHTLAAIGVRRRLSRHLAVELQSPESPSGIIVGQRAGTFTSLNYYGSEVALLAVLGTSSPLLLMAGPAMAANHFEFQDVSSAQRTSEGMARTSMGGIVAGALEVPVRRFLLGAMLEFRRFPDAKLPAHGAIPAFTVSQSDMYVAGGVGIRF